MTRARQRSPTGLNARCSSLLPSWFPGAEIPVAMTFAWRNVGVITGYLDIGESGHAQQVGEVGQIPVLEIKPVQLGFDQLAILPLRVPRVPGRQVQERVVVNNQGFAGVNEWLFYPVLDHGQLPGHEQRNRDVKEKAATWAERVKEAGQRPSGSVPAVHVPDRPAWQHDGLVTAWPQNLGHVSFVKLGREAESLAVLPADSQHVGRLIRAFGEMAGRQ